MNTAVQQAEGADAPVTIYSTPVCPYCVRAKQLLQRKGVAYNDIDLSRQPEEARIELMQKTKQRTVPQIFVKDTFIGGFDQLYALEQRGELDKMLAE
ncbi:glutaredoxin 3 [Aquirhabdus parva]|uniref:Glutaredoxin n=1 Tax=Aquirhabdus parva TaxID=2283318 RepID=A0A345P3J5_9GAMM|nr:glutaredoxin 3 [Aquirhabdus parva]AXI01854.1 glutaredoxin 3 [Aquirhabdus parva]